MHWYWYLIIWVAVGAIYIKSDEHVGGWLAMIGYNYPGLALVLYVASVLLWPLHIVNSSLQAWSDYQWRKEWSQEKLYHHVTVELGLQVPHGIILPQSVKSIAKQAHIDVRQGRLEHLIGANMKANPNDYSF